MTCSFIAIDGPCVGSKLDRVPAGYHCVMTFDNHPDLLSCHPKFKREQFILAMLEGLEAFTDNQTTLVTINLMRHGRMNTLTTHVLSLIIDTNEYIWGAQLEARSYGKSKN